MLKYSYCCISLFLLPNEFKHYNHPPPKKNEQFREHSITSHLIHRRRGTIIFEELGCSVGVIRHLVSLGHNTLLLSYVSDT